MRPPNPAVLPTVAVRQDDCDEPLIINASDYDATRHTLYERYDATPEVLPAGAVLEIRAAAPAAALASAPAEKPAKGGRKSA